MHTWRRFGGKTEFRCEDQPRRLLSPPFFLLPAAKALPRLRTSCARCSSKAARRTPTLSAAATPRSSASRISISITASPRSTAATPARACWRSSATSCASPTTTAPGWSWRAGPSAGRFRTPRAQETRYATTATGYVEIGGGYDSNVNSGIGNPVISVPTLGAVQLTQAGVKSGSSFLHLGAGGSMSHPVAPGVALLGGASAEFKLNAGSFDKQFDLGTLAAYGGASVIKDKDPYRATVSLSTLDVGYNPVRDAASVGRAVHPQVD